MRSRTGGAPVFVVCLHRTGSTLLRNMLNENPVLYMMPEELDLLDPYPWAKDMRDACKGFSPQSYEDVAEYIFSKRLHGALWKKIGEFNVSKEEILEYLTRNPPKRCIDVFNAVFTVLLEKSGKKVWGAKYPVHIAYAEKLLEWYPEAKILHLTRDPRAIFVSKAYDELSRKIKSKLGPLSFLFDIFTLSRIVWEYKKSVEFHRKFKGKKKYMLVRFEDLVAGPETTLRKICSFLDIPYTEKMLYVPGKASSIDQKIKIGPDPERVTRWKKKIKNWQKKIIDILLRSEIEEMGYKI